MSLDWHLVASCHGVSDIVSFRICIVINRPLLGESYFHSAALNVLLKVDLFYPLFKLAPCTHTFASLWTLSACFCFSLPLIPQAPIAGRDLVVIRPLLLALQSEYKLHVCTIKLVWTGLYESIVLTDVLCARPEVPCRCIDLWGIYHRTISHFIKLIPANWQYCVLGTWLDFSVNQIRMLTQH